MNVTVIGSFRDHVRVHRSQKEQFEQACASVGRRLAELGHRLIVPHPNNLETAEAHALRGFQSVSEHRWFRCSEREGDPVLKAHLDAVEKSDAVILIGGLNGTYTAGLSALRKRKLIVPIPAFGGSAEDLCDIAEIDHMLVDEIRNLQVGSDGWLDYLVNSVDRVLNAFPRVLIIHGRGDSGMELRERILTESNMPSSDLQGIAAPLIMNLSGLGAITVSDAFEGLASSVSAAITIVTADDVGGLVRSEGRDISARDLRLSARARENVWVEVGWFWGRLGRGRVFLWLKDLVALPSDLSGAAWTQSEFLDGAWESIRAFLIQLRTSAQ